MSGRDPAKVRLSAPQVPSPTAHLNGTTGRSASQKLSGNPERRPLPKLRPDSIHKYLSIHDNTIDIEKARLEFAARFVVAAVEGRDVGDAPEVYRQHRVIVYLRHRWYRKVLYVIIMGHMLLPLWSCHGQYSWQLLLAKAFILAVYVAHILLHTAAFGQAYFRDKRWEGVFAILVGIHIVVYVWSIGLLAVGLPHLGCDVLRAAQLVRPYLLVAQLPPLRRVFANILRTVGSTRDILFLGLVAITLYSVLGIGVFNDLQCPGYSVDNDNFNSFGPALLSLYILTTTENFPAVADPAFKERPLVAYLFFISFLLAFLIVILPLMLGIVLDSYAHEHTRQLSRARLTQRKALLAAYYILDDDGVRGINHHQFAALIRMACPTMTKRQGQVDFLWESLLGREDPTPRNNSDLRARVLNVNDFLNLADVLHKRVSTGRDAESPTSTHWDRQGLLGAARFWSSVMVRQPWFHQGRQAVMLLLALVAILWTPSSQESFDRCIRYRGGRLCGDYLGIHVLEGVLLLLYAAEVVTQMLTTGTRRYFQASLWNTFDAALVVASGVGYIFTVWGKTVTLHVDEDPVLSDWMELPRALRVLRLVVVFPNLKQLMGALWPVSRIVMQILLLYFCVSYSFAVVGMWLMGDTTSSLVDSRYSFGTFPNALLTLFFLTVRNNWNDLIYPIMEQKSRWLALYFVAYVLFCATIMLDIVVGVVIEGFRVSHMNRANREARAKRRQAWTGTPTFSPGEAEGGPPEAPPPPPGGSSQFSGSPVGPLVGRRPSYRYSLVQPQDMFRSGLEQGISEAEVLELEAVVQAIEERLQRSWEQKQGVESGGSAVHPLSREYETL